MTFRVAALVLTLGGATALTAQTTTLTIDPMHSEADFTIVHMGLSHVHGQFNKVSGTITLDASDMSKSQVEATIPVDTVDTGVTMRDNHLKSPDFFDVAKYPDMTFKSTSVHKDGDGYKVDGVLTMHGVSKTVTLQMDPLGKPEMMHGETHRGFEATTTLNRQDFGLKWAGAMPNGDAMIGNDVKVTLDVEASDKPAGPAH